MRGRAPGGEAGLSQDCIFCRIVAGEIPANVILDEGGVTAFHDIAPKAPVHALVVPDRHVTSLADLAAMSPAEQCGMLEAIAEVARRLGIEATGYRVTTNHGPDARQSVHHLHWHVMGGGLLSDSM